MYNVKIIQIYIPRLLNLILLNLFLLTPIYIHMLKSTTKKKLNYKYLNLKIKLEYWQTYLVGIYSRYYSFLFLFLTNIVILFILYGCLSIKL